MIGLPSILCNVYVPPSVELLGFTTPSFKRGPTTLNVQTRLTPVGQKMIR